jgi:hypothetical protein
VLTISSYDIVHILHCTIILQNIALSQDSSRSFMLLLTTYKVTQYNSTRVQLVRPLLYVPQVHNSHICVVLDDTIFLVSLGIWAVIFVGKKKFFSSIIEQTCLSSAMRKKLQMRGAGLYFLPAFTITQDLKSSQVFSRSSTFSSTMSQDYFGNAANSAVGDVTRAQKVLLLM